MPKKSDVVQAQPVQNPDPVPCRDWGLGANAIGLEKEQIDDFRGGPTTDGVPISELNKMVPWQLPLWLLVSHGYVY